MRRTRRRRRPAEAEPAAAFLAGLERLGLPWVARAGVVATLRRVALALSPRPDPPQTCFDPDTWARLSDAELQAAFVRAFGETPAAKTTSGAPLRERRRRALRLALTAILPGGRRASVAPRPRPPSSSLAPTGRRSGRRRGRASPRTSAGPRPSGRAGRATGTGGRARSRATPTGPTCG